MTSVLRISNDVYYESEIYLDKMEIFLKFCIGALERRTKKSMFEDSLLAKQYLKISSTNKTLLSGTTRYYMEYGAYIIIFSAIELFGKV